MGSRRGCSVVRAAGLSCSIVLAAGFASSATASEEAKPLSRGAAIALALAQNPTIAAARAKVAEAEALKRQADAARWPSLTFDALFGPTLQAELVQGTGTLSTKNAYGDVGWSDLTIFMRGDAQLIQPLYTFGKIAKRREAGMHGIRAREHEVDMTRAGVALEVARLYEGRLLAGDAVRVFEEMERTSASSIQSTQERLKSKRPTVAEEDLLRLQVAQGAVRLGLSRARAGLLEAEAGLRAYLGLPPDTPITIAEETLEPIAAAPPPYPELATLALDHRPELGALREGVAAYERLADAERAGYFPDFFALGLLSGAYTPGRDLVRTRYYADPFNHFYPGIAVGLRWTLQFDSPGRRADEKRAEARRLGHLLDWAILGVPAEVRRAYEEVQRAKSDIDTSEAAGHQARQWLVRTTADYAIGLGDSRAVADSVQGYVLMRMGQLESRFRYNVSMAELAQATGTLTGADGRLYPGPAGATGAAP